MKIKTNETAEESDETKVKLKEKMEQMRFLNAVKKEDDCKRNETQKQNESLKVKAFKLSQQAEGKNLKKSEHEEEIKRLKDDAIANESAIETKSKELMKKEEIISMHEKT